MTRPRPMQAKKLDELKLTGALPSPSGVGLEILSLTRDEDYSIGDLTHTIQLDPALTGRIIKLANMSSSAGLVPARNVSDAVMRLGVRSVRNVALGFTLVSGNRSGVCSSFDFDLYWSQSLAAAVVAQYLSGWVRGLTPTDAFTCSLLAGIGRLALASVHPEPYSRVLVKCDGDVEDLIDRENGTFETNHRELAAALLADWRLPDSFSFAVASFELEDAELDYPGGDERDLTGCVRASWAIAQAFTSESSDEASWRTRWLELDGMRESYEIPTSEFGDLLERAATTWREWGEMLTVPTSDVPRYVAPAVQERPADEAERESVVPERQGLRILAVDDDSVSLRVLVHHLTNDGHDVAQARNGREALSVTMTDPPQLIVTDWMMPEMDGIEFCKTLRLTPAGRSIYVLILTGREEEERIVQAFDAGADDYVVKPFNAKILLARVRAGQRMIELREQVERDKRERARQIAEMAVLNRKLRAAALTDVLTELPNRRYAMKRLEQEVAKASRSGSELSLMMLDIDYFKRVNDVHGHDVGDHVLRELANVLRRTTRRGDVVCRLGGEEFLVICANSNSADAVQTAERVREAMESHAIRMGDDEGSVTVSIGVAEFSEGEPSVDALLKAADQRVYLAKNAGRNRVVADDLDLRESA